MKQLIQDLKSGKTKVEEVPIPALRSGGVLVRNVCSLVSAGTERMLAELAKKSLIGKAKERPDLVKQVISKAKSEGLMPTIQQVLSRLDSPMALGYSSSGVVIAVGDEVKEEFKAGDKVACGGSGYANHADYVFVPKNLCIKIPDGVDFESAAFTTLGAITLQGVRQADIKIGEVVAVIGLGLVGQLTVQILKASGCKVIGFDINSERVRLAKELGVDTACSEIPNFRREVELLSKGNGADAVIIAASTKSRSPIVLAGEASRMKGKVVIVGDIRIDIPRKLYYEKELDVKFSMAYGPGRYDPLYEEKGIDYPLAYVRWTEGRNMEAFLALLAEREVNVKPLITHRFPIDDADKAYELLSGKRRESYLAILLDYNYSEDLEVKDGRKILLRKAPPISVSTTTQPLGIGVIGAGNFAKGVVLPALRRNKGLRLRGIATASGMTARHAGDKFGFEYCTSDYREVLNDPEIDCIFILTRHELHAKMAKEVLEKKRHVFVEKPLATVESDLSELIDTWEKNPMEVMVGFNRRFSPFIGEALKFLENRKTPLIINYRVNAGVVPKESWIQSEEGGGRIIGEVCHFVDLLQFLTKSTPIRVFAESIYSRNESVIDQDNINITLKFKDGSVGMISYVALGDKSLPKEYIEIFGDGAACIINDFRSSIYSRDGKVKKIRKFLGQDKGHQAELERFITGVKNKEKPLIPFEESVLTTMVTFKIIESLNEGMPVDIPPIKVV